MTMTRPQTVNVEHVGGPYDGYVMPVQADEDGNPPEFYTLDRLGPTDISADPSSGPIGQIATQFYDRELRVDGDGPRWVFVYRGETYTDAAA